MPRRLSDFDELDRRLVACLFEVPQTGLQEVARRLGVARGTVDARLRHLMATGVIAKVGPHVNLKPLGYVVDAFAALDVDQASRGRLFAELTAIPNVLEAHIVAGRDDILCRVTARDNDELRRVLDMILAIRGVRRSSTQISLTEAIPYRVEPLLALAATTTPPSDGAA